MMTRDEHIAWAKRRALEELAQNGDGQAMASFLSDLNKHPETSPMEGFTKRYHEAIEAYMGGSDEVRRWIEAYK